MFERQLGLRENPFAAGHHPRYVYPSHEHQEALAHLRFGVENREAFVLITGEVGTGKTTAIYDSLSAWGDRAVVALITNSVLSRDELLEEICLRFGVPLPEQATKPQALIHLERHLIGLRSNDRFAILLLDEAQNLSDEVLEEIRLLSNVELKGEKLLQIFLVGQPELEAKLSRPELRQIRQRIAIHYRLSPLSEEETTGYIHHRISVAGGNAVALFPAATCREIYRLTHGIPREINTVASQALVQAFVDDARSVSPQHIHSVEGDTRFRSVMSVENNKRNRRTSDLTTQAGAPNDAEAAPPARAEPWPAPTPSPTEVEPPSASTSAARVEPPSASVPGAAPVDPPPPALFGRGPQRARRRGRQNLAPREPLAVRLHPVPGTPAPAEPAPVPTRPEPPTPTQADQLPSRAWSETPPPAPTVDVAPHHVRAESRPPVPTAEAPPARPRAEPAPMAPAEPAIHAVAPPGPPPAAPEVPARVEPPVSVYTPPQPVYPASMNWFEGVTEEPTVNDEPKKPGGSGPDEQANINMPAWLDEVLEKRKQVDAEMAAERERSRAAEVAGGGPSAGGGKPAAGAQPPAGSPPPRIAPHPANAKAASAADKPSGPAQPYISPRLREKLMSGGGADEPIIIEKTGGSPLPWIIGVAAIVIVAIVAVVMMRGGAKKEPAPSAPAATATEPATPPAGEPAATTPSGASSPSGTSSTPTTGTSTPTTSPPAAAATGKSPAATTKSAAATKSTTRGGTTASKPSAPLKPKPAAPSGGTKSAAATGGAAASAPVSSRKYGVAVGTYLNEERATQEKDRISGAASLPGRVIQSTEDGGPVYRVVIGSFDSRAAAEKAASDLLGKGLANEGSVIALPK